MTATTQQRPQRNNSAAPAADNLLDKVLDETQRAMLRPEFVQMKMENETIISECRARPRDMAAIRNDLKDLVDTFPEFASEAIYNKPVGREGNKMKFARGLSVRAAEALAEAYGYNRVRAVVSPLDADSVTVEATFFDYQSLRVWSDSGILSKWYMGSGNKGRQRHNEDRFYSVVVKAEVSRRVREVIIRMVNAALKAWFEAYCEEKIDALLDDAAVAKIITKFAAKDVTKEMLSNLLGRGAEMGWTKQDRATLLGIWNAIKDGESTVAEVFSGTHGSADDRSKEVTERVLSQLEPAAAPKPAPPPTSDDDPPAPTQPTATGPSSPASSQPSAASSEPSAADLQEDRDQAYMQSWYESLANCKTLRNVEDLQAASNADSLKSQVSKGAYDKWVLAITKRKGETEKRKGA